MAMAQVMSGMPDVWQRVLAEHVPDQSGRCQACRDEGGFSASWPCLTREIAEQAKRIHDEPPPEFPTQRPTEWHGERTLSPAEHWHGSINPGDMNIGGINPGGIDVSNLIPGDPGPDPAPRRPPLRSVQRHTDTALPRSSGRHAAR